MTKNTKFKAFSMLSFVIAGMWITSTTSAQGQQNENLEISAKLSGTAFVTTDLEASVHFYSEYLSFRELKRIKISGEAGLSPFGLSGDHELDYVSMVPAEWSREHPNFPGLNFVEISSAASNPFKQEANRSPMSGEIVMAYAVKGLVEIEKKMRIAGVPIVTPIGVSATGKSQTLTVIDPNGVRVQMYEYLK